MIESIQAKAGDAQDGMRLDLAAVELFPSLSRKKIKTIIDQGGAYVNKKRILFAKHEVRAGDKIELFWQGEAKASGEGPRDKFKKVAGGAPFTAANILFESENFLVVNKPAGLASQATLESDKNTVIHAVHACDRNKYPLAKLMLVHRLDKETSGLLLIARNGKTREQLENLFKERKVQKTYEAIVLGQPRLDEGSVTLSIVKDNSRPNAYYASSNPKARDAKTAHTDFKVVERFARSQAALVECLPKTGRTHQIRVHMSALGCPLLGDKTYAQGVVGHPLAQSALRHMLHAKKLSFTLNKDESYSFEAPLPSDFEETLNALRSRENSR